MEPKPSLGLPGVASGMASEMDVKECTYETSALKYFLQEFNVLVIEHYQSSKYFLWSENFSLRPMQKMSKVSQWTEKATLILPEFNVQLGVGQ
jgi:hypothetical protein